MAISRVALALVLAGLVNVACRGKEDDTAGAPRYPLKGRVVAVDPAERKITVEEARELFANAAGIKLVDDLPGGKYPMPKDCDGDDATFIGRLREDISCENGLTFWCVSDNLRKGAATNAVQIAELLIRTQAGVS